MKMWVLAAYYVLLGYNRYMKRFFRRKKRMKWFLDNNELLFIARVIYLRWVYKNRIDAVW